MGRWICVLVLAACGSNEPDPPPRQMPRAPEPAVAPAIPVPAPPPFDVPPPKDKLVAVARAAQHACVVRESGAVDCWGNTIVACKTCALGPPPDPSVRRLPGIDDAIGITENARCFIRRTGEVACLEDDTFAVKPLAGITDAVAGDPQARCFVGRTGGVTCLDYDDKPWKVPGLTDAVSITSSSYVTCVVRKTGTVACGSVSDHAAFTPVRDLARVTSFAMTGELGIYACSVADRHITCFELPAIEKGKPLVPVYKEEEHSLQVREPEKFEGATQLVMWSTGRDGQYRLEAVVDGTIIATRFEAPWQVPVITDAAIHGRECAIRATGALACWGSNLGGALAQPTTFMRSDVPPTQVVGLSDVSDIAVGLTRSYALTRDGRVWWWGSQGRDSYATPRVLALGLGPTKIVQLTADSRDHACMRGESGEVWCQVAYLEDRIEQLDTDGVRDIAAHGVGVLAYRTDGSIEVHAIASDERYGDAPMTITPMTEPEVVQSEKMGQFYCQRYRDGTVACPSKIEPLTAATTIAADWSHACAIQRGRVWCWLESDKLGTYPVSEIPGIRDATDIGTSVDRACAVHDGGKLSCWRYREDPGSGDVPHRVWLPPEQILSGGAADVELGRGWVGQYKASFQLHGPDAAGEYTCARMIDRTVRCWGMNLAGELGDGSMIESASPIGVRL